VRRTIASILDTSVKRTIEKATKRASGCGTASTSEYLCFGQATADIRTPPINGKQPLASASGES
jgi:hypothetical protein